jgi:hypothetical protein
MRTRVLLSESRRAVLLTIALTGAAIVLLGFADPTPPPDSPGVKWSTLKRKMVDVMGQQQQAVWDPYGFARATGDSAYLFYGYEVQLQDQNGKPIGNPPQTMTVWYLPGAKPANVTQQQWDNYKYWCHGRTFDEMVLSVGGEAVNEILAASWKLKACLTQRQQINLVKGDIVVYTTYNGFKNPPPPPAPQFKIPQYVLGHSAKYNGDGTFTSKNRFEPLDPAATFASMEMPYANLAPPGLGPNGTTWASFGRFCCGPK